MREWNEQIIFLRKIIPGGADKSYGIQVARLAGLPKEILDRAKEILAHLESSSRADAESKPRARKSREGDAGIAKAAAGPVISESLRRPACVAISRAADACIFL